MLQFKKTTAHDIIDKMHLPGVKGPARSLGMEMYF